MKDVKRRRKMRRIWRIQELHQLRSEARGENRGKRRDVGEREGMWRVYLSKTPKTEICLTPFFMLSEGNNSFSAALFQTTLDFCADLTSTQPLEFRAFSILLRFRLKISPPLTLLANCRLFFFFFFFWPFRRRLHGRRQN